jgi:hypothetical protein
MTLDEFNKKWTEDAYNAMIDNDAWEDYVRDCFDMYEYYGFRKTFRSPYEQFAEYIGKPFNVVGKATEKDFDITTLPAWQIEFADGSKIWAYPEEICKVEDYMDEYNELLAYNGKTTDEIRNTFGTDITNDDGEHIDTNYKDILVTFDIKDGIGKLSKNVEAYSEEGVFIGTFFVET